MAPPVTPRPRRLRRLLLLTALALTASLAVQPPFVAELVSRVASSIVWKARTSRPIVALTFDDGPDPVYTHPVLDLLAREKAKATFFLVGGRARQHPEIVKRIRAEGHEVGNHTDSHGRTLFQSDARFEQELIDGEKALELGGSKVKLFRPPGIWLRSSHQTLAARHGYLTVLGSAYAFDPYKPPVRYIEWVITRGLRPGAIVVLHDSGGDRSHTLAALPAILRAARDKNLQLVTLSELLTPAPAAH
jgi:peptidoglycan/xylan/chitin deacetylase (PgdA/CDA1 family)